VRNDVIIIGGGFAGVAAACRLAGDGLRPLLLERAPCLGGRAASVVPKEPSEVIDIGQHVLMRCCSASTGFLARIGASDAIRFQPSLSIPIVSRTERAALRSAPLPGPLHLAPTLLRYRFLPLRDRIRAMQAGVAIALGGARSDVPFARWLEGRGQSDRAIAALWDPICVAALNAHATDVGARAAHQLVRDAFLRPGGADIGLFTAPLCEVFAAARRYLETRGGSVRVRAGATRLLVEDRGVSGVQLQTGELLRADSIVCAVPPWELARLAEDTPALRPLIDAASRLHWAPIVNLHAWFDRPVLDGEFAVAVDSPVQAAFDITQSHGGASGRGVTHIVVSQSAADDWIDRPFDEVSRSLVDALADLFPRVRQAACLRTLVVRHRRATFVPKAGTDRLRPSAVTPIDGLFLAGDWTLTGWPSTIEGAIRSGIAAAAHAGIVFG